MSLPDLIEIVPLEKPVHAEITVPGSKSITNRALILAALADGESTLEGALWSEDTQVMVDALRKLGFEIEVLRDEREFCNRSIKVKGRGGKIPNAGTEKDPLQIFVGNAGTAARFLAPLVCLGHGVYRLHGVPRMHERPQAALLQALRELGYRVDSPNDRLPVAIHGTGPRRGKCQVSIEESSQFASGLIMSAGVGAWKVEVTGDNPEESPYVVMTSKLVGTFPKGAGSFYVEPDASGGSYFIAAGRLVPGPEHVESHGACDVRTTSFSEIRVLHWPKTGWQIDERFPEAVSFPLLLMGLGLESEAERLERASHRQETSTWKVSRKQDLGDSIMTAIVLAPFGLTPGVFTNLDRMRLQECERVVALRTELTKCGAKVIETDDTLEVFPSRLHGAEIETYGDHRMAMCFAVLGLKVASIRIRNPSCVKKTFPNFFQKLATPPPHGLGATILDATTGRKLALDQLFAE
jgi:3-phosphoshikimate 1-carboxyvinyltransferase